MQRFLRVSQIPRLVLFLVLGGLAFGKLWGGYDSVYYLPEWLYYSVAVLEVSVALLVLKSNPLVGGIAAIALALCFMAASLAMPEKEVCGCVAARCLGRGDPSTMGGEGGEAS